jgi:hypothetical protein
MCFDGTASKPTSKPKLLDISNCSLKSECDKVTRTRRQDALLALTLAALM